MGVGFTAEMEEELDEVADGQRQWQPVVHDFYEPLKEALSVAESGAARRREDRRGLRQVRQADGHPLGTLRALPRLHRLPRVQEHAAARRRRKETRRRRPTRSAPSAASRWSSDAVASAPSSPAPTIRPAAARREAAGEGRRRLPGVRRRHRRQADEERPHVLRLLELPDAAASQAGRGRCRSPARTAAASSSRRRAARRSA